MPRRLVYHSRGARCLAPGISLALAFLMVACSDPTAPGTAALAISSLPDSVIAGVPDSIQVTAQDASGHTMTGYTGTVHFTSNDPLAQLPADYHFQPADLGAHQFQVTFGTAGLQSVVATDVNSSVAGSMAATVTLAVSAVRITPSPLQIVVGGQQLLSAHPVDAAGSALAVSCAWNTSDAAVATISSAAGVLSALTPGTALIRATCGGVFGEATVTVVPVPSNLVFAAVSTGGAHSCGVTTSGALYCWGDNFVGQIASGSTLGPDVCTLGTGTGPCALTPSAAVGGLTFATVDAGYLYSCGITTLGTAYCWGYDPDEQPTPTPRPVAVLGGLTFATISAGWTHTCGVTTSGTAYCWGLGIWGELGAGGPPFTLGNYVPEPVAGGLTFTEVSAGTVHICGVTTSGAGYCWGENEVGELGVGDTLGPEQCSRLACSHSPAAVVGGLHFKGLTVGGGFNSWPYTCGVTTAGAAYCWGHGYGAAPVAVAGGLTFAMLGGAGPDSICGVTTAGAAYCWSPSEGAAPVAVGGGVSFAALSPGHESSHTCGTTTAGVAYCWGGNDYGQLGDGTQTGSSVPVKVAGQP